MSVAQDFKARWAAFRFPSGKAGFVGVTAERDHFMVLSGGGLWTSFGIGREHFLPWIVRDNGGHGNFTAMVHVRAGGRNVWAGVQKVVKAEFRDARPFGIVETSGEYAGEGGSFRLHLRFTFAGGCAGFLVELAALENLGAAPLDVPAVYLRVNAGGQEKVVPLPKENGWLYPDGRQTVVTAVDGGHAKFWFQANGSAHPDVALAVKSVIAPGVSWKPTRPLAAVYAFEPFTEDGK